MRDQKLHTVYREQERSRHVHSLEPEKQQNHLDGPHHVHHQRLRVAGAQAGDVRCEARRSWEFNTARRQRRVMASASRVSHYEYPKRSTPR